MQNHPAESTGPTRGLCDNNIDSHVKNSFTNSKSPLMMRKMGSNMIQNAGVNMIFREIRQKGAQ